jgi:hypothetical protein
MVCQEDGQKPLAITRVWQKWRFSAPQTHLWLIKVWFSASTFVLKIATFAKPETVGCKLKDDQTSPTNSDFSTKQTMTVEKYFQSFY